jgi:hypothetical protein
MKGFASKRDGLLSTKPWMSPHEWSGSCFDASADCRIKVIDEPIAAMCGAENRDDVGAPSWGRGANRPQRSAMGACFATLAATHFAPGTTR